MGQDVIEDVGLKASTNTRTTANGRLSNGSANTVVPATEQEGAPARENIFLFIPNLIGESRWTAYNSMSAASASLCRLGG